MSHRSHTTVNACEVIDNGMMHCDHEDESRTFALSKITDTTTVYLNCASPAEMSQLIDHLIDLMWQWKNEQKEASIEDISVPLADAQREAVAERMLAQIVEFMKEQDGNQDG